MFFPNLRKIPALFEERFQNSSEFSLLTGWTLWTSITIVSYFHYLTHRNSDQAELFGASLIVVVILIAIGFPGAFANVLWSKVVKKQEPNRQLLFLFVLIIVYYAPVVIDGWPKGDGVLSLSDVIYYAVEMFSLVLLRIFYSEILSPLFQLIRSRMAKGQIAE